MVERGRTAFRRIHEKRSLLFAGEKVRQRLKKCLPAYLMEGKGGEKGEGSLDSISLKVRPKCGISRVFFSKDDEKWKEVNGEGVIKLWGCHDEGRILRQIAVY